jgi:4-amino-4-deoxy-L-arabinose transferase-like glycosyltransferase
VRLKSLSPSVLLLLWVVPLILIRSTQQSLMAHDEGIYAAQARSILLTGDWLAPQWGGAFSFDRTIGIQWLIAGCYSLFGISEGVVRLPSAIAYFLSVFLTYRIGIHLLTPRLAWIGAAIFSVIPLVAQYGRLGTQDMVLVCIELTAIWALLNQWRILAGACFGLGFMIKGFMVIPAAVALLPFLLYRKHLLNPRIYIGLILGAIPVAGWLWFSIQKYGNIVIAELFGKLFHLKAQTYQGAGPEYYFWNVPANGFPWVFFALWGIWLACRNLAVRDLLNRNQARSLLLGFPILLFMELTLFGTRTHYYPLQLMPFVGLLAAIALEHMTVEYMCDRAKRLFQALTFLLSVLGLTALVLGIRQFPGLEEKDSLIRLVFWSGSVGWFGLVAIYLFRKRVGLERSAQQWLAGWLLTSWVVLSMLNITGLWGNYDPDLKTFLEKPNVREVLRSHLIQFVVNEEGQTRSQRKTHLLLNFYTPQIGSEVQLDQLAKGSYAWVDPTFTIRDRIINDFKGWKLIKKQ